MAQGLALYDSLLRHSSEPFTLWILPLDDKCWYVLRDLSLPHVQLIALDSFVEEMNLEKIRDSRSYREWCWTCASQLCEHLMHTRALEGITYCDSDVYFFADPVPVFNHIGTRSIAITPHQFPDNSEKPRLSQNGAYNVGFIHFKNTSAGRGCLWQWAAQVRERCSADVGCGDQCYLDFFQRDYGDEVCVLGHGINAGPWNLMAYDVTESDGQVFLGKDRLICYHMHEYVHDERLTNYPLRDVDRELIYSPYVKAVEAAQSISETVYIQA